VVNIPWSALQEAATDLHGFFTDADGLDPCLIWGNLWLNSGSRWPRPSWRTEKKSNRVNDYMPVYLWLPHCARHPAKIATSCKKKTQNPFFFAKQSCSSMSERAASFFEDFHASNSGFIPTSTGCF
jgi:hypothetical protein